ILGTGETLLQATYRRMLDVCAPDNIWVITNEDYVGIVKQQLPDIHESRILGEPARKNTAPCAAYAAWKIHALNPDACLVMVASDHLITREDAFARAVHSGLEFVENNNVLLTLGIKPHRPDTGYGYIQFGSEALNGNASVRKVKTFTEKPSHELAETFLKTGEFFWNSGNFIWK